MKCNQKGCEVDGPTESGHCPVCGHVLVEGNGETDIRSGEGDNIIVAGCWSEVTEDDAKAHFFQNADSLCGHVSRDGIVLNLAFGSDTESADDCKACVKALEALGA